jgi:hypothetical protein
LPEKQILQNTLECVEQKNVHKAPEAEFPFLFLSEATFTEQMLPLLMPTNIIQFYVELLEEKKEISARLFRPNGVDLGRDVS